MKFFRHNPPQLSDQERLRILANEIRAQGSAADVAAASLRAQSPNPQAPKRPSKG